MPDYLSPILARTAREVIRRTRRAAIWRQPPAVANLSPVATVKGLRRTAQLRVIAEVKFRSPSAGSIRARTAGAVQSIAQGYAAAGAAAVSVLADRQGFGGSALDVRRAASAVEVPVLFKGFVLDEVQLELARAMGASLVLLLVRAVERSRLQDLCDRALALGLTPVVEAADEHELKIALDTGAAVVGVNARDLSTFRVDLARAVQIVEAAPQERVRVVMSGVRSREALTQVAESSADAVLIGEGLMRAASPGDQLSQWIQETSYEP